MLGWIDHPPQLSPAKGPRVTYVFVACGPVDGQAHLQLLQDGRERLLPLQRALVRPLTYTLPGRRRRGETGHQTQEQTQRMGQSALHQLVVRSVGPHGGFIMVDASGGGEVWGHIMVVSSCAGRTHAVEGGLDLGHVAGRREQLRAAGVCQPTTTTATWHTQSISLHPPILPPLGLTCGIHSRIAVSTEDPRLALVRSMFGLPAPSQPGPILQPTRTLKLHPSYAHLQPGYADPQPTPYLRTGTRARPCTVANLCQPPPLDAANPYQSLPAARDSSTPLHCATSSTNCTIASSSSCTHAPSPSHPS